MQTSTFFSILLGASSVTALGINCRGSALCDIGQLGGNLAGLIELVGNIPDTDTGAHIACAGHLCAFSQNYDEDIDKQTALDKLNDLK